METILNLLTDNLALIVSGVIVPLVARYIKKRVDNEKVESLLLSVNEAVGTAVASTTQIYAKQVKRAKADGKLTDDEKKNARSIALREAKRLLGGKLCKELQKRTGDLKEVLETYIEAELLTQKRT